MVAKAWLLAGALCCATMAAEPVVKWSRIGSPDAVKIGPSNAIALNITSKTTAGAVSTARNVPRGADAVLVSARIADADERALTFSVHDTAGGDTLAYWQNYIGLKQPITIAAVLVLDPHQSGKSPPEMPQAIRLFAGSDQRPSTAKIDQLKWQFVHRGAGSGNAIWAYGVNDAHHAGQSFVAAGKLAAVKLRIRYLLEQPGPGLKLSIYRWQGNIAQTRQGQSIGQAALIADAVPAGVEGNERDVTIALPAATESGKAYLLEIIPDAPMPPEQKILLWAGPGNYEKGQCFDNNQLMDRWDLCFETYYAN